MKKKQAKALKALSAIFDGAEVKAGKPPIGPNPALLKAVSAEGLSSYIGWINHAGRVADGTYQVQFDVPGDGWSSRWPEWAYEAAVPALLSDKKVWVISNGVPFGPNLLMVLVTHQNL